MDSVSILSLGGLLLILAGVVLRVAFWPRWRRRLILRRELPPAWLAIMRQRLACYDRLPPPLQERLTSLVKLFLADKQFIGCAGQHINDDIRITIAAQACLLLLGRGDRVYEDLQAILLYPSTFITNHEVRDEIGLVSIERNAMLGESWGNGRIVLAWDNVEDGIVDLEDGYNLVLHEFAHQLDHESGAANGTPLLAGRDAYQRWNRVLSREFEHLQDDAEAGRRSLLDHYGASDPAEFFAVATETFFERPRQMAWRHRELYQELAAYYGVSPIDWLP